MSLTLAVPCHNEGENLLRLLRTTAELGLAERMVVVDDASGLSPAQIRHDIRLDPGAAATPRWPWSRLMTCPRLNWRR